MSNIHTIREYNGNDPNAQYAREEGDGNGHDVRYQNPMMACCSRIPIVTIIMASVEFLLWFVFIFIDDSIWLNQTCTTPSGIERGEVWRLITPSILHWGYSQIFFDILFLFMMGIQMELQVGSICFIWLCVLFTVLTYLVNFVLSGIPAWAGGFRDFYDYCGFGIYPMMSCLMILQLRLTGSKWTSFFMLFPIPSALLPFLFVGLCLLFSFSYLPCFLLLSGLIVGFLTWTGVLRFLVPRGSCLVAWESKCCPRLSKWRHWSNAKASDNVRHFPVKMGEGPEPLTCCCNRWKPPQQGDVENRYGGYGYEVRSMDDSGANSYSAKANKKKKNSKKNKKGGKKRNISCDTSTSSLGSWGKNKGAPRTISDSKKHKNPITVEEVGTPQPQTQSYQRPSNTRTNGNANDKSKQKKDKDGFKGTARHL